MRKLLDKRLRLRPFSKAEAPVRKSVPDDVFIHCPSCQSLVLTGSWKQNLYVCPGCGHHFRLHAWQRVEMLADKGSFQECDAGLVKKNWTFPGYREKWQQAQKQSGLKEAVIWGTCTIGGYDCVLVVMDAHFLMGSMGQAAGEKITRAIERATAKRKPLVICSCSGGARMQEGIFSLVQMAKTSAAIERFSENGGFYLSILTHPVTGGVLASFASLGDVILAEPDCLVGFAGRRVIEKTIQEKLPSDFQKAEFLLEKGFIDRVVDRRHLQSETARLLALHERRKA